MFMAVIVVVCLWLFCALATIKVMGFTDTYNDGWKIAYRWPITFVKYVSSVDNTAEDTDVDVDRD